MAPAAPDPAATGALPPPPGRPPRKGASRGTVAALVLTSLAASGVGIVLTLVLVLPMMISLIPQETSAVTAAQGSAIDDILSANRELTNDLSTEQQRYLTDVDTWQGYEDGAQEWRDWTDSPPPPTPNPGGNAMPGSDPDGRDFLDSIGATTVTISFDAGSINCGYKSGGPGWVSVGGCYNRDYPDTLFLAWDQGAEDLVDVIFVHEAMHWYQIYHNYEIILAIDDAGLWSSFDLSLETDASCRAVYEHGFTIADYAETTSPCYAGDDWSDTWLRDQAADLGVMVEPPTPENYEVLEEARP